MLEKKRSLDYLIQKSITSEYQHKNVVPNTINNIMFDDFKSQFHNHNNNFATGSFYLLKIIFSLIRFFYLILK